MRFSPFVIGILTVLALVLIAKNTRYYFIAKRFYTVDDNLYRGGKQRDAKFTDLLHTYNFKLVISLAGEINGQRKIAESNGAKYVAYHWRGSGRGPFDEYLTVARLLKEHAGESVFYHCWSGEKRTNAATYAYYLEMGLSPEAAFAHLHPYGFSELDDAGLHEYLLEYTAWREEHLRQERATIVSVDKLHPQALEAVAK
jgi:hypothetical protein